MAVRGTPSLTPSCSSCRTPPCDDRFVPCPRSPPGWSVALATVHIVALVALTIAEARTDTPSRQTAVVAAAVAVVAVAAGAHSLVPATLEATLSVVHLGAAAVWLGAMGVALF